MLLTERVSLHRTQADFRRSSAFYRGFVGGRSAGKSWVGAYDLIRRAKRGRTYMVVGPTYPQLRDSSLRSFLSVARRLGVIDPNRLKMAPPPELTLTTGACVLFRSADDPERLRGPNLSGAWLDEASLMSKDAFDIVIAALREGGEQGWLSATFTPKGVAHWTYELFGTARPDTAIFHAGTRDNPFNPPGFADTLGRHYDKVFAAQELGGEFVDDDDGWLVIPPSWVRAAQARWTPTPPEGFPLSCLGADVARGGRDCTVIVSRYGPWFSRPQKFPGTSTPDGPIAAMRVMACRSGDCPVNVDVIGVGSSVYDHLKAQIGRLAVPVNNAEATDERDRTRRYGFANVRAASYWRLREALDPDHGQGLMLPPDPEVLADLTAPRYTVTARGIQLEKKEDLMERLGRSPDVGDAVVLAFWEAKRRVLNVW